MMTGNNTQDFRLLVIDDEQQIAEFIRDVAEQVGYEVTVAENFDAFRRIYAEFSPTLIALDLQMPGVDGVELLRYLAAEGYRERIIVISGMHQKVLDSTRRLGREYGLDVAATLQKPVMLNDLREVLEKAGAAPRLSADDLREAIELGQIVVHYQPKVDLSRGPMADVTHAEALVRWQHPARGLLMPDVIIPLAESTGLIRDLTDSVLRAAIEQMKQWQDTGVQIAVAVNLAPDLLDDIGFPDRLENLLREFDVAAEQLCVEITERGAMGHVGRTMDILTRLRLKGIGLAIDDFGTGSSSLVQLFRMPFSEIKIDRSFVAEIADNADAATIVRAVIELSHNLGMRACAEGVETHAVSDALTALGCDTAQGFLYSRAVTPGQLLALRDRWRQHAPSADAQGA
ncbi:EAL domain-containing response regulator [soil metagenome]